MGSWGLAICIVQKEGSLLSKDMLMDGHHLAKDAVVKLWLADIESGKFTVESNLNFQITRAPKKQLNRKKSKAQQPTSPQEKTRDSLTEDEAKPTQTQAQRKKQSQDKSQAQKIQNQANSDKTSQDDNQE
ncbi:hypothetical protein DFH28DRAFT_883721 [Melampsora americana]|nr:hypothetical protein DFH28DRAFT_883721 [Melampsora americana]